MSEAANIEESELARTPASDETGGRALTRNSVLNILGLGLPLLVAVVAVPHLDRLLGTERYGLLLIAWMLLGYFSLFDLGLGRALTHLVADRLSTNASEVPALIRTCLILTAALGVTGGILLAVLTPWIAHDVLSSVSPEVAADCERAFYLLAACVPIVVLTAALRGLLEARHRFDLVNLIRLPLGVATFAGPLLIIPFHPTLLAATFILALARIAAMAAHAVLVRRAFPEFSRHDYVGIERTQNPEPRTAYFDRTLIKPLAAFAGWMTVSNIVSPLMVYMDRLIIGAVLTASAVAYYATPWEVVTKFLIIPGALSTVLFPAFSSWRSKQGGEIRAVFVPSLKALAIVLFPLTLLTIAFAEPALFWWMGPEYAAEATRPMQILALGVFLNGIATIPFSLVQGVGRPDVTAKLHLLELPVYGAVLAVFIYLWGITGVAIAWSLRTGLDLVLLLAVSRRFASLQRWDLARFGAGLSGSLAILGLAFIPYTLAAQFVFVGAVLVIGGFVTWRFLLEAHERRTILRFAR